jgi:predicted RecB family nuclease
MKTLRLSKSKFMSGLQCHKRLYLEVHRPELGTEPDEAAQAVFDEGTEVGRLAHKRFPGGVLVAWDHEHVPEALKQTAKLFKDPSVPAIFEGAFLFDGVLVRVDVLKRVGKDRWRLIEVKASTDVKDHYLDDVAVQTYVVQGNGVDLAGSSLMHVNNQYVHPGGEVDVTGFFTLVSLTDEVKAHLADVPGRLAEMRAVLKAGAPPAMEPDGHCSSPHPCQFWEHCITNKPARWVFYLPRVGQKLDKLRARGIESIDDIPDEFPLSEHQQLVKEGTEWVDAGLKAALRGVRYPVHHLDFETLRLAIPRYAGTRPYQQIPFQWSNHVQPEQGPITHQEYLHLERTDPREPLLEALLKALGRNGTICVYTPFEQRILSELGAAFPKFRGELDRVIERLWDLKAVVQRHYYHPGFGGSYSLKAVLPALLPAMAYDDLAIQDGDTASLTYARLIFGDLAAAERDAVRADLLAYCGRDTLAMVEIRRVLMARADRSTT